MTDTHVVIVNYNAGRWLVRAIESALKFSTGSVSVVDNASTDDSVALAQAKIQDARLDWVLNAENRGFAAANNQVLAQSEATYVVLMNPDCELHDGTLSAILRVFESDSRIGLVSTRILNEDGSMQATCRRRFPTPWSAMVRMLGLTKLFPNHPKFADFDYGADVESNDQPQTVEAISGAFMVVRREALGEVGLLDEGYFMHCEDLDWCMRFKLAGWEVVFVPEGRVTHAKGVSSRSRPIRVLWTLHKGMNRFFDKFYQDQYSWPLRWFVKAGIWVSFVVRAGLSLVRR